VQDRWDHESGVRRMRAKLFGRRRSDGSGWQVVKETNDIGRLRATDPSFLVFWFEGAWLHAPPDPVRTRPGHIRVDQPDPSPDDYRRFLQWRSLPVLWAGALLCCLPRPLPAVAVQRRSITEPITKGAPRCPPRQLGAFVVVGERARSTARAANRSAASHKKAEIMLAAPPEAGV